MGSHSGTREYQVLQAVEGVEEVRGVEGEGEGEDLEGEHPSI